ncbi:hypothetical protein SAMN06272735_0111 [Streptomyces sp. TLI_55]|nr:hypothetical protein SAMN06272735_0111 [Streptomyces sp. TLI_55]
MRQGLLLLWLQGDVEHIHLWVNWPSGKGRWGLPVSRPTEPEGIAGLFTSDGRWVVDGEGASLNSHEGIRERFRALSKRIP